MEKKAGYTHRVYSLTCIAFSRLPTVKLPTVAEMKLQFYCSKLGRYGNLVVPKMLFHSGEGNFLEYKGKKQRLVHCAGKFHCGEITTLGIELLLLPHKLLLSPQILRHGGKWKLETVTTVSTTLESVFLLVLLFKCLYTVN